MTYSDHEAWACTPPLNDSQLTGGYAEVVNANGLFSCDTLFLPGNEDRVVTYNWNDQVSYSTITYTNATVVNALGQIVITETGTVTAGNGLGSSAVLVTTEFSSLLNNCGTSQGQESFAGQQTLAITAL
ncbi:hypothetical protein DWU98_06575 [Dyella monticola]|uniref:Uncharacterized protein n=1 Tax=Dyella monticola TaxID=1927958 RepID=A0A370X3F1_9GAMM|nr:hypothetical protein [Dyella monticola]RDS82810.1 hypothetical protein DWU98_06575 [Dyella monticola]